MSISSSTCHICLDELDFDLRYLKKKCCPSKAFICNECWEKVLSTEEIVKCPLCRHRIKAETIVPVSPISGNVVVRTTEFYWREGDRQTFSRGERIKKFCKYYILTTILGAASILTIVYFLHPRSTTFEREFEYLTIRPFFWIMSTVYGLFFLMVLDILFGKTLINRMRGSP